jgi:predicted RNase H-like nuclease (RuvC/YqgF family)
MYLSQLRYLIFVSALTFLVACSNEKVVDCSSQTDSLIAVNKDLLLQLDERDSLINNFMDGFNEIQTNLETVKTKQLSVTASRGKRGSNDKKAILQNIDAIDLLMKKNKETISSLKGKLKGASKQQIESYEKFIANLENMMVEKDKEIMTLLGNIDEMNAELGSMISMYNSAQSETKQKAKKLNTAYYTAGTAKELMKKKVISQEGGFIGFGKMNKLSENFNTQNFVQIDITTLKTIKLQAKKVKLITTHPPDSYSVVYANDVSNLMISNPEKFWAASKYLVVLIEKK